VTADGFTEIGEPIDDVDRFMDDAAWWEWAERVAIEVEERNAWLILASGPDGEVLVLDVLDAAGRELPVLSLVVILHRKLKRRNIRHVRFFRWTGPC
jgi:hypothetical protein